MLLFNWQDQEDIPFTRRYRTGGSHDELVLGRADFENLAERLQEDQLELNTIRQAFEEKNPMNWKCPRLFISHRMVDFPLAERIAWLASMIGWDYWLDVHDPGLAAINSLMLSPKSKALAVALIIEVALLNCTHVLATITNHSPGSAWIPYEYGRVKPSLLASQLASCWVHPCHAITTAEYMNLGPIFHNEQDIRRWLSAEKVSFGRCTRRKSRFHGRVTPNPLPR